MRMMLGVVVVVVLLFALYRALNAAQSRPIHPSPLPALDSGEYQENAAIADGPDRGFGVLRLTPTQLVFAGNSGRVVTVERLDITGVTSTTTLPDRSTAKPVLAVTTGEAVFYFAVDDPGAWEQRLL